ncbi:MAG: hypothetical protein ACYDAR_02820 [Thermomicrobiales bacterium]
MNALQNLLDFLQRLDEQHLSFQLKYARFDTIMILIHVPGEYWEVEFFADGHVEVEIYHTVGGVLGGEELLERLFAENTDS